MSTPNLSTLDFPALTVSDGQSVPSKYAGDDLQHSANPYRSSDKDNMLMFKSSSSLPSRGAIDFASAVRKMSSQDSGMWKYDRNGSADSTVGSSRSSHGSANTYNAATGRGVYANRVQTRSSAPVWLETGDAVGNILHLIKFMHLYSDLCLCAYLFALTLLSWQQICTLNCGKKLETMHVYVMHISNRYLLGNLLHIVKLI